MADIDALAAGVLRRDRRALAKAITLIESRRADHRQAAGALLARVLPHSGNAMRVGISGAPGVGKSTFIEALGMYLIGQGHRVAVLAIDPSSSVSGGSILGDKTRMGSLAMSPAAFIRPSPSAGNLGGVAATTREAILVLEAAGFDVVLVETVGVGQSEIEVASMTDFFLLLQLPHAGDELQALKKGIVELADLIVINKADVDPAACALTRAGFETALSMLRKKSAHWQVPVISISALRNEGIAAVWQAVEGYRVTMQSCGEFAGRRSAQRVAWMESLLAARLQSRFARNPQVASSLARLREEVSAGQRTPQQAVEILLSKTDMDRD